MVGCIGQHLNKERGCVSVVRIVGLSTRLVLKLTGVLSMPV